MNAPARKPGSHPRATTATTVKLPEDTKARVAAAAQAAGKTTHAFMVEAIEDAAARAEKRREFVAEALEAEAEVMRTGKAIPAAAVDAYLKARVEGKNPPRPKPVKWRK